MITDTRNVQRKNHFFLLYLLLLLPFLFSIAYIIGFNDQASAAISVSSNSAPPSSRTIGSQSWQHTTNPGSNQLLIVGYSGVAGLGGPSSVTYNGIPLSSLPGFRGNTTNYNQIWYLKNPPVGTYTLTVTTNPGTIFTGGATTLNGVNLTNTFGTPLTTTGIALSTTPPRVTFSGTNTNQSIYSIVSYTAGGGTMNPGSGHTLLWRSSFPPQYASDASIRTAQTGSTPVTWNLSGTSAIFDLYAIPINAAIIPPTPTPTRIPTPTPTPLPTPIPSFSISGNVFQDPNRNGIKDSGEINYAEIPSISSSQGTVITNSDGSYIINNISGGMVTISYNNLPAGYVMTIPLNGPPPTYQRLVTNNISNLNFGITNSFPWIQSTCGDIRIDSGFNNRQPSGQSAIITNSSCSNPGIIFTGDSTANFGQGNASNTNRIVGGSSYPELYPNSGTDSIFSSYNTVLQKAQSGSITIIDLSTICTLSNCTLPINLPNGIYQANGDVALNAYTFSSNRDYVFIIDGNLTIKGNVLTPPASNTSTLFSTAGDIYILPTVGNPPPSNAANVSGIFSTDRSFIVESNNNCNDLKFNFEGTLIINASRGGGSLQNLRNLCVNNANSPTMSFSQRLDFLFSLPEFLKVQSMLSEEVAP